MEIPDADVQNNYLAALMFALVRGLWTPLFHLVQQLNNRDKGQHSISQGNKKQGFIEAPAAWRKCEPVLSCVYQLKIFVINYSSEIFSVSRTWRCKTEGASLVINLFILKIPSALNDIPAIIF